MSVFPCVVLDMLECPFPAFGLRVPGPSRHLIETALPFRIEGASGVVTSLAGDPGAERVAVEWSALRNTAMPLGSDEVHQFLHALLPVRRVVVPNPTRKA